MLNPDVRSMYTNAVTPPPGYIFDQALATTYSLDPAALLSLPTHIALGESTAAKEADPIKLLESLRRLSGCFSVYADHAGMKVPSGSNVLFGLLEKMVTPVKAPRGGVFHPKVWVLRFVQPDRDEPALIRLLVLSRNITFDRSWDISLQLEGTVSGRNIATNHPLSIFLKNLPDLATTHVSCEKRQQARFLAEEVRKTQWELPEGFEEIGFHILGMTNKAWTPAWSKRMVIISPFISDKAVEHLYENTDTIVAIISRPEELNALNRTTFKCCEDWYVLDDAAETEDGEEPEHRDTVGLHAKVYICEEGSTARIYLGSANATTAAIFRGNNIELLVELTGKKNRVGSINNFLSEESLGPLLSKYDPPEKISIEDKKEMEAQKTLDGAKRILSESGLSIQCTRNGDTWDLHLVAKNIVNLHGISQVKAWPITVSDEHAVDIQELFLSATVDIGKYATESVTSLIAFELTEEILHQKTRLVLNLPIEGLPSDRDDAIFKLIVKNRNDFLRYILLLLGEDMDGIFGTVQTGSTDSKAAWRMDNRSTPLLEEMVRAFSRHPEKISSVQDVVDRLMSRGMEGDIVPKEFLELWKVFDRAHKGKNK
ncbi:MAG: phospholipase D family protein [Candidatus Hydrogenedentes bacterium]|nr:phospholipase D family protein [Candidatus Hydrogenedentota bacterium]